MWSAASRQINPGLSTEMGMMGLRDVFVVAPASSFNPNNHFHHPHEPMISDHHSINASIPTTALGVGVGVIPLLTAAHLAPHSLVGEDQNSLESGSRGGGVQLWPTHPSNNFTYLKKQQALLDHNNSANLGLSGAGNNGGVVSGSTSSSLTCQDCGNQAKKDCRHRRCRTCCISRGLDCATHIKSTWVPVSRRREQQTMTIGAAPAAVSSASTSGSKKPRLLPSQTTTTSHTSTSNTTPRSFDTSSSHQDVGFKDSFPGQVRAPAVFKCVKVTAVENGEGEYAYQAVVRIGGHVFKGFLYDQGVESRVDFPNMSDLHLGSGGAPGDAIDSGYGDGGRNSQILDHPLDVYSAPSGGLLGGSGYGNHPLN